MRYNVWNYTNLVGLYSAGGRQQVFHITHKVLIYTEYHSVCPLVRIGDSPKPFPESQCATLEPTGGEAHSPSGGGWGSPNSDDWRKSLALCHTL